MGVALDLICGLALGLERFDRFHGRWVLDGEIILYYAEFLLKASHEWDHITGALGGERASRVQN